MDFFKEGYIMADLDLIANAWLDPAPLLEPIKLNKLQLGAL